VIEIDTQCKLTNLFAANRDRRWYFVNPGGNWGDHLIYAGAESLARSHGLSWTSLDYRNIDDAPPPPGSAIYLHGGGGLNPWCSGRAFAILRSALRAPGVLVIQGPQTCDTANDETRRLFASALAETAAEEVHFFVRELTSARYLAEMLPPAFSLHVEHDTAFHLPLDELLALAGLRKLPTGRYSLIVSREDDEISSTGPLAAGRDSVRMDPANYARDFSHWLRIHAFATQIASNRLHSAIVGSLLGKPVQLLPGSYHKNRSVWEFSLKERGVEWRDRLDEPSPGASSLAWLPERIRNSWKVRRALFRARGVPLK
jgi:hypothetical protein